MNFAAAIDTLTVDVYTLDDIASQLSVPLTAIQSARAYTERERELLPERWRSTVADLARQRANELMQLAEQLEHG